jgi:hypothetical protein
MLHPRHQVRLLGAVACVLLAAAAAPATAGELGTRVKKFAQDRLGRKVGDGECATLAVEALRAADARTTFDYGVSGPDGDYRWGKLLARFDDAQPGDVIQYRDVKIVSTTTNRTRDGVTWTETRTQTMGHHTAIVSANLGGGKLRVLEQNVGPLDKGDAARKVVQENELNLSDMTSGKVWIYRPVQK